MNKIGKDQTYSRKVNSLEVIKLLKNEPQAATVLADALSLSNATMSSILKSFLEIGLIKVSNISSIMGVGRKRVYYELNNSFGLVLCVNISNYHARITVSNIKAEILKDTDIRISKYDANAINEIILESSKLLLEKDIKSIPLKYIVVSLPGRVNTQTGELALSEQFDQGLFSESNYIKNAFLKQFPNVQIKIVNDTNLYALGELKHGSLKNVKNAMFISIDYGIGGAIIYDHKLFHGDNGYAGEFGLFKYYDGVRYTYIDGMVSLRVLEEKVLKNSEAHKRNELMKRYNESKEVKDYVLSTASILGKIIRNVVEVFDISHIVVSGAVIEFGEDYLNAVIKECLDLITPPEISFSPLKKDGEVYGGAYLGVEEILNNVVEKEKYE